MTFSQAQRYLLAPQVSHIRPGLGRIQALLHRLGDPQRQLRVIHIAGTNGKGSTAEMIRSMLTAGGYRAGLFSSPAVTGLCGTVTVDGVPIGKRALAALTAEIAQARQQAEIEATSFEMQTALALLYFARQRTDVCVIECGMGGQGDATNVFPAPLCGVITPVALDHTDFLGGTLAEIARQKAGILKAPGAAVVAPGQPEEVLAVIYERAAEQGIPVYMPAPPAPEGPGAFRFAGQRYRLPLLGQMQQYNAATALQVMDCLALRGFGTTPAQRRRGLAAVRMPCRQEIVSRRPWILLDGAHNPHNTAALADTLRQLGKAPYTLVFGMLADKDTEACCRLLAPLCGTAVCCTPPSSRALAAVELAAQMKRAGVARVLTYRDPHRALAAARRMSPAGPLVITGSLYLCAGLRPKLAANDTPAGEK